MPGFLSVTCETTACFRNRSDHLRNKQFVTVSFLGMRPD